MMQSTDLLSRFDIKNLSFAPKAKLDVISICFISFLFFMIFPSTKSLGSDQIFVFSAHTGSDFVQSSAVTAVKSRLSRSGFMVRDNLSLLGSLRITPQSHQSKVLQQVDDITQLVGTSILVFVNTQVQNVQDGQEIRMSAELYNSGSNSFLTSWSVPNSRVPISTSCGPGCASERVANEAQRMGDTLGNSLAQLLQRPTGASASDGRLITILEVEIIDFESNEIIELIDLMRNEFPGFEKITKIRQNGPRYQMLYHTTADRQKLVTWIDVSLAEIGLEVDQDVQRIVTERRIDIRKFAAIIQKSPTGNTVKYN
jgi:hypothetical protein